jgi:hypothetical protein
MKPGGNLGRGVDWAREADEAAVRGAPVEGVRPQATSNVAAKSPIKLRRQAQE